MLVKNNECCGCGVCSEICVMNAIDMRFDKEGFIYPNINNEKCINCGLCEKYCPVLNEMPINNVKDSLKSYAGYYEDENKLKASSSGGVASALAEKIIDLGGLVCGVAYSKDYTFSQYTICQTKQEICSLQGTKYFQSRKGHIYKDIEAILKEGKKLLFIGLPCEVAAVKRYIKNGQENLYTCELICHGPTTEFVQKDFMMYLERKYKSKVLNYNVRYKKMGWTPLYVRAEFESGKVYEMPLNKTKFGFAFAIFIRPSCYHCNFRNNKSNADITIGDFWGEICHEKFWNPNGVSAIITHTNKGRWLLRSLDGFKLFNSSYKTILLNNPRLSFSEIESGNREKFSEIFKEKGLVRACNKIRGFKRNMEELYYILFRR